MTVSTWIATTLWVIACSIVSAALLAFHVVSLPAPPAADPRLEAALRSHADPQELQSWRMVHVIYERCACSQRIIDHLVTTQRPAGVRERVLLVDGAADTKHRLAVAGFAIDEVTAVSLRNDWAIESAPLLLVADSSGGVRYAGGYSTQKQGPLIEDLALFASVTKGEDVLALPLFGCAVSQQLKTAIDPLGLQRLLAWRPFS